MPVSDPGIFKTWILILLRSFRSLFIKPSEGFPSPLHPPTCFILLPVHIITRNYTIMGIFPLIYCLFACLFQSMLTPQENNDLILLICSGNRYKLYLLCLGKCLAPKKGSVSTCWMNKWMNKWMNELAGATSLQRLNCWNQFISMESFSEQTIFDLGGWEFSS